MAHALVLPCQNLSSQILYSTQASLINNVNPPTSTKINLLRARGIAVMKESIPRTKNRRKPKFVVTLAANSGSDSTETSMSYAVKKLYTCINDKDLKQLEELVSDNCIVEDSAFPYKFMGKREVVRFFTQLIKSMGKNVQFRIGTVCEGDELTASVDWHLEWEEDQIPFTRGCTIFQFSSEEDKLVIGKAQIITESPIKPGNLAMAFLEMLTSVFDDFPKAAKWFLKSPNTILKAVLTIYNLFVAPFVHPVLTCYLNLWKFIVQALGYIIGILHFVAKCFKQ